MSCTLPRLTTHPSKGAAFAIHVALSLLVFSSLVLVMVLYWFPGELFFIDGGWQGLKLVAMVDLVLGPALTLLLYKPGKPKLALDLSLIAVIQISALAYGFYTTYQQRTVALVYAEKRFHTLSNHAHQEASAILRTLDLTPQPIPKVSLLHPPMLLTPSPAPGDFAQYLAEILNGYPGPQERSDQFVALETHRQEMKESALSMQELKANGSLEKIMDVLQKKSLDPSTVEFHRFKARYANGLVIFNPSSNRIVDYLTDSEIDTNKGSATATAENNSGE